MSTHNLGEAILMSTHNTFLWRTDENDPSVITKYPPYLFCYFAAKQAQSKCKTIHEISFKFHG